MNFFFNRKSPFAVLTFGLILMIQSCSVPKDSKTGLPNIILIMSDDMGYSDLGCYGGEIETPNLDFLAQDGLKFTQFYNTARCCPTRASLMTGLYPHQTGIGHMTNPPNSNGHDYGLPAYRGFLSENTQTIAEVLKTAGYTTLMTGKWHLGMSDSTQWPLQRGFDKFYGILAGACNYFKPTYPRGITSQNDTITINEADYYTTDAFTQKAINFIDESANSPFFLYLAYNSPHWPVQAPKNVVDKYRERYQNGWEELRMERYERMQKIGIIDPNWVLSPRDSKEWDSLTEEKKKEMSLRMAIYAAMVDKMDQNIGRLIDYLKEENILDNTLIIFLDDNGACAEGGMLGGGDANLLETEEGYFLTYGKAWANASNTPFREYKHWIHEGGISSPLIIHWPNKINPSNRGTMVNQYGFLPDIMATIVDVTGAKYRTEVNGRAIPGMQGESLLPLINGIDKPVHNKPIFWEHEGNKAVRLGKYKLVMKWKDPVTNEWELYDMENDRTELNNLASELPEKVEQMKTMWDVWARENKVEPWDKIQEIQKTKHN